MKALKINVETQKVEAIELDGSLQAIYEAIGNECSLFACPEQLDNGDALYVDDEGLFHEIEGGIMLPNWSYPIVGNILVVGTDVETGESIDCKSTIDEIEAKIIWVSKEDANYYAETFW